MNGHSKMLSNTADDCLGFSRLFLFPLSKEPTSNFVVYPSYKSAVDQMANASHNKGKIWNST